MSVPIPGNLMKPNIPKRIALIGPPGCGKSTFASKLAKLLDIPVHHLDRHMFEGGEKREKQEFLSIHKALIEEDSWIIEGCFSSTFEMRFTRADTLLYFHVSPLLCFWRIFKRLFNHNEAFGGLRKINWEILKYIWTFEREKREGVEQLRKKYPEVDFRIFKCSKDADNYIKELNV